MITYFKLFEDTSIENYKVLGTNESSWSWDDDSDNITAQILLNENDDSLYLKIRQVHTKHGLGAGQRSAQLAFLNIGTLKKADLSIVRTLLKKHAHQKSRGGHGFSAFWSDEEGNKMNLTDLIKMHKPEKVKKELKHLKPIDTFETIPTSDDVKKDIDIVKYSARSYAIFGKDTKNIKDDLLSLGCKYNRFLTDPRTGEKRPGWICTLDKIDKIKEIL